MNKNQNEGDELSMKYFLKQFLETMKSSNTILSKQNELIEQLIGTIQSIKTDIIEINSRDKGQNKSQEINGDSNISHVMHAPFISNLQSRSLDAAVSRKEELKDINEMGNIIDNSETDKIINKSKVSSHETTKQEILDEPNKHLEDTDDLKLRNLIIEYGMNFNSNLHERAKQFENECKKHNDIIIKHAQIGYKKQQAINFEVVKIDDIYNKLEAYDAAKIKSANIEEGEKDRILFELCPQVFLKGQMILKGKVIVG